MARILYGVMGDARGHVSRALTVAEEMPDHEFLFIGGGQVHELEAEGYSVEDVPMASTLYRNNSVDIPATAKNALKVFFRSRKIRRMVAEIIKDFDPDLILTDYEYFTPLGALSVGRPCVSIDHQHVMTHCKYETPRQQYISRITTCSVARLLYSNASQFFIISFFQLPPIDPRSTIVLKPLIRKEVRRLETQEDDHVLVYQTSSTFVSLLPILEKLPSKFIIYGFGQMASRNNLLFRTPSKEGFLEDLASCRYVITNGGHNVICEALYLGKPLISFPIANAYEQFLNAYFLEFMGFGKYSNSLRPKKEFFVSFEAQLHDFKKNILGQDFLGNRELVENLTRLLCQ